ncbi:MAG: peptidylprolyl isomerase [Oscillospiraceae bacterium]|nr:peptidylprolyl isomerase [Oscillospiraceae bacterium]
MKKTIAILILAALLLTLCACSSSTAETAPTAATAEPAPAQVPEQEDADSAELRHAEITVRDYGVITLELDAGTAPITVANFVKLAQAGFYDGLTFHRIMDGFMIQGGDPNGNGSGGSDEKIKGEFAANGVENNISHVQGVISMARAQNPDSASSQFFITVADATFLDGSYAAFGWVTDGLDVVLKIAQDAQPIDNNGTIPADQQPVIESIVITD